MKTILVLFGGCSTEYEVSLHSAYAVLSHMDPARYTPLAVGITREGQWLCYTGDLSRLEDGTWQQAADCIPCTPLVEREAHALLLLDGSGRRLLFDAVFPVLHGKNGEDGTVQGLFELAGVPVIGCGTLSSALCMDKDRAHQLAALAGIRVPRSHVFHSSDDFSRIAQAAEELGYPVFVKPVRAGSSFGITKVSGPEELPAAMEEAFRHDSAVILEETIPGFEVGCAVMGNEELTVGLVDEIALSEGFFNYEEKYTLKTSAIHCPARIPPEKAAEIQAAAKTIYRALDCRVFARVDLFLTPDGEIVFNEVNTIPGFTAHSRYPSMMQGIGISFGELPLATVLTPNIPEAEILSGLTITDAAGMEAAARTISQRYGCAVLCKGGHQINDADDLLWRSGCGKWFRGRRIPNPNTHGTGCTLSSAIAANLAKGYDLDRSVERAKAYISGALAAMLDLGRGSGPMNHMFDLKGGFAE